MSIIADRVRRLDIALDKYQLSDTGSDQRSAVSASDQYVSTEEQPLEPFSDEEAAGLNAIVRALSVTSTTQPVLSVSKLSELLHRARDLQVNAVSRLGDTGERHETDLEWLVGAKGSVQVFGLLMDSMLQQTLSLDDGIWYWDEILGSYSYTGLHIVQTSPVRMWQQAKGLMLSVRRRHVAQQASAEAFSARWKYLYGLVQQSLEERSVTEAKSIILSPFAVHRSEVRRKRKALRKMKDMNASGIGLLMEEGLSFGFDDEETGGRTHALGTDDWRSSVSKSVLLMETVLQNVTNLDAGVPEFEDGVFAIMEHNIETVQNQLGEVGTATRPALVIERLTRILDEHIPRQREYAERLRKDYDRPSRLIRYWPALSASVFSLSTVLRILTNRRAEIITWACEFGETSIDFWANWVVDPIKKLIGTIRHDDNSQLAIMSKDCLQADCASLERMVVDFVSDHPDLSSSSSPLSPSEVDAIRNQVRQGILEPVMKAYERDVQKPFVGTVRGDLVRALLIQIQKTKVDVDIAISGIDSLLKSQELVFGFVSLTPGIIVSYTVIRWLGGVFGSRKGLRRGKRQGELTRALRNVHRVLTSCSPTSNDLLSYKDHGLLLCEVHVLLKRARQILPGMMYHDFKEDVEDLLDIHMGVTKQMKVLERIQWAYARWIR